MTGELGSALAMITKQLQSTTALNRKLELENHRLRDRCAADDARIAELTDTGPLLTRIAELESDLDATRQLLGSRSQLPTSPLSPMSPGRAFAMRPNCPF